jgi:hypothetical protein
MMFECVLGHFAKLSHVKNANLCSSLSALFWGTKDAKHAFYSIRRKMMFGNVSEHFSNLRHIK